MSDPMDDIRESYQPPEITLEDFEGWLLQKESQGIPRGHLLKVAITSANLLADAADRWARLEGGHHPSAPFWMTQPEAARLLGALRGERGTELRLLRQSLQEVYDL